LVKDKLFYDVKEPTKYHRNIVKMVYEASCGLLHLHANKVLHRDLALRNVLLGKEYVAMVNK